MAVTDVYMIKNDCYQQVNVGFTDVCMSVTVTYTHANVNYSNTHKIYPFTVI